MSDRTNEDTLIDIFNHVERGEVLRLEPSSEQGVNTIEVYVMPITLSEKWSYLPKTEKEKYWKASLMAVELHREYWLARR